MKPNKLTDTVTTAMEPLDWSEVLAKTDIEMQRLHWTVEQGRQYMFKAYGKRSRSLLTEEELLEFLRYLEFQPTPEFPPQDFNEEFLEFGEEVPEFAYYELQPNSEYPSDNIYARREVVDVGNIIARIGVEIDRLGWTTDQGREYLIKTYGKRCEKPCQTYPLTAK